MIAATLFLFVKAVDEAALIELADEAHIDELFGFGGLGSWIALCGIIENRFEPFEARVLFLWIKSFSHHVFVTFLQSLTVQAAAHIAGESLDRRFFVGPHSVHRLDVRPNISAHRIGMLFNVLARGCGACMLKYQTHLRDIGDNSQAFFLTDKTRRRIDDSRGNSTGQSCTKAVGSAAHLHERHLFARRQTDFSQGKSCDRVGSRAETADRYSAAFELLDGLYAWLPHEDIIQGCDPGGDKNRVRSRERAVDQSRSGNLRNWNIARDKRQNRGGTAGEKYQLDVKTVLSKYSGFFGNPSRELVRAGRAITHIQAGRLAESEPSK